MEQDGMSEWFEVPYLNPTFVADETFARCFDSMGKEIAVVGFGTGLRFLIKQIEDKTFFAVDPACLPKCTYVFKGVIWTKDFIDGKRVTIPVESDGSSDGSGFDPVGDGVDPWTASDSAEMYVSVGEWRNRLSACWSCSKYKYSDGTCTVNGRVVSAFAKRAKSECPDGVWAVSASFDEDEYQRRQAAMIERLGPPIVSEDQAAFEEEWESRRAS
jgi:hypothetical protein